MKRLTLLTSLLGLTTILPLSITACAEHGEQPDPIVTEISIEPYWRLNYVASVRSSAPFKLDFAKQVDGQTAQIKIIDQVLDSEPNDCLKFTDSGKDTISIKIDHTTSEKLVYIETTVPLFDNVHEISFSFEILVKQNGCTDKKITFNNLWLEVARPTVDPDMFTYQDNETKKILTGINQDPEKLARFNQCNMLIIPDTVEEIADYAFSESTGSIKSLLPSTMKWLLLDQTWGTGQGKLKRIGAGAFKAAPFTGILRFPNSLIEIGQQAFRSSAFTGSLIFPDSVEIIGNEAFRSCKNFDKLEKLPKSDKNLSFQIFTDCTGFKGDIIIPDGWESIPATMFSACTGFDGRLVIPDSVEQINNGCFNNCRNLKGNLKIPYGVKTIGSQSFYGCSGFTGDLVIPNSVTNIGSMAFSYCTGFNGCLKIPYSIETISNNCFNNCPNINQIDLTEWVTIPADSYTWLFQGYKEDGTVWINETQDIQPWKDYLQTCGLPEGWICQHKEE